MLIAHIVPGYFAAVRSQKRRRSDWTGLKRAALWAAAISGTVFPDADVIGNLLFNRAFGHHVLWTHAIWAPVALLILCRLVLRSPRYLWANSAFNLFAVGWLSHIGLDLLVHGTPLFYPLSMIGFELAPSSIVEGGLWTYLSHPLFLLEPLMLIAAVLHWTHSFLPRCLSNVIRKS